MAQGPDGGGFKPGHRLSQSLYADKATEKNPPSDETTGSEERDMAAGVVPDANETGAAAAASEVDAPTTVVEDDGK